MYGGGRIERLRLYKGRRIVSARDLGIAGCGPRPSISYRRRVLVVDALFGRSLFPTEQGQDSEWGNRDDSRGSTYAGDVICAPLNVIA